MAGRKPKWKSGATTAIRIPEQFAEQLLKIAQQMDEQFVQNNIPAPYLVTLETLHKTERYLIPSPSDLAPHEEAAVEEAVEVYWAALQRMKEGDRLMAFYELVKAWGVKLG